jgi:hypothetical protein
MRLFLTAFVALAAIAAFPGSGWAQFTFIDGTPDIEVDDNARNMPGGRIAYEIFPGNAERRRGSVFDLFLGTGSLLGDLDNARNAAAVLAVDSEIWQANGRDQFSIGDFQTIRLGRSVRSGGSGEIDGPTRIDAQIDGIRGYFGVHGGGRFFDILTLVATGGVVIQKTEVDVRNPGRSLTEQDTAAAAAIGSRLELRVLPAFDLYGRAMWALGDFVSTDVEAGGQINLTPNIGIYAAYRRMEFWDNSQAADWEYQLSGPTFGLSARF